ncbi:MAG: hypothetical protein KME17_27105 [Cyanosarcina radialis HA8281-LM2]|jgi:hypothetical protein|nr:hypothetical protein [Cyanosarcina radialis HA8281-LM2]
MSEHQKVTKTTDRDRFPLDPEIIVSLAAVPVLLAVVGIKKLSEGISAIGSASEEIFRGDRLPVLHFPDTRDEERA